MTNALLIHWHSRVRPDDNRLPNVLRRLPPHGVREQRAKRVCDGRDFEKGEWEVLHGAVEAAEAEPEDLPGEEHLREAVRLAAVEELVDGDVGDELWLNSYELSNAILGQDAIALPGGEVAIF